MIDELIDTLSRDSEYYYSWQANIAMQFQDEVSRRCPSLSPPERQFIYDAANQAAINFLNLLMRSK